MNGIRLLVIILIAGLTLTGCQNVIQYARPLPSATRVDATELTVIPATAMATATVTPTFTPPPPPTLIPQEPPPTRLPTQCQDDQELVLELSLAPESDASYPVLPPGSQVEKGWRVRNTGDCTWDTAYLLAAKETNPEWALTSQPVPVMQDITPGALYDFWIELTAPGTPGTHKAEWVLINGQGEAVGSPLTIDIEIAALPTETAQPKVTLIASPLEMLRGEDSIIAWSTIDAKAAYFYPFGQVWWQHPVEVNGSILVEPERTTTYELRAIMGDDSVEIRRITIEIEPFDAPKITSFTLKPGNVIDLGQCVDIHWRIDGRVNSVKVYRDGNFFVESQSELGTTWDCPARSGFYTYTLRVIGPGGTSEADRKLEVR